MENCVTIMNSYCNNCELLKEKVEFYKRESESNSDFWFETAKMLAETLKEYRDG